ncbi:Major Facilitator Superfamily protein [Babesia bovis T2Bo]|uniref:Transporter, putative n=1 Tax=Babesia bovis TaxID=5865 RepID=A7ASH3_BABBO|nr:Major Facilitator Superfamily protein [Babesia bovis T2Bo]EDO07492.1 Major Facilitator Superfamily protein [Babesia bovis T2Bo]BAN65061.1 transporter, putative [Babesia bovis]|eukprot:XP_001611060.1 transporter [Babesia bovis T2Bo]
MASKSDQPSQLVKYGLTAKILYHLLAFMDGYDIQSLSVCMRAFEISLGLSPSSLAWMASVEIVSLVACGTIWGYLADFYKIRYLLCIAMNLVGLSAIGIGCASNYALIMFLRVVHGAAMGCTAPAIQQIVTGATDKDSYGTAFGIIHAVSCFGRLVSAILITSVAIKVPFGKIYGWRICYIAVGIVWILLGALMAIYLDSADESNITIEKEPNNIWETLRAIFRTWTSIILLFAIFISDAPFAAFTYMILYLQYLGLSDLEAGVACALTLLGGLLGGGFGGFAVDMCHKKSTRYGRLIAGNAIMLLRLSVTLAFFLGPLPQNGLSWYHYVEIILLGSSLMTVSAIDRPIMGAVVEKKYQASATGINRCIAGILSSLTFLPLAGLLTEMAFGYQKSQLPIDQLEENVRSTNSDALRKAMMFIIGIGTVINTMCYIAFFFTYPKDSAETEERENEVVSI